MRKGRSLTRAMAGKAREVALIRERYGFQADVYSCAPLLSLSSEIFEPGDLVAYHAFDDDSDHDLVAIRARLSYHLHPDRSLTDEPAIADWAGFYVGVNAGVLFSDDNVSAPPVARGSSTDTATWIAPSRRLAC
jgi:hypothetical protein